jgi:IS6 family transposase
MRSHQCSHLGPAPRSAFAGYRFPPEVITLAVRWYLRFDLSSRDVEELLAKRGIEVDRVSIYQISLLADLISLERIGLGDVHVQPQVAHCLL